MARNAKAEIHVGHKELVIAEAGKQLQALGIRFDKVTFISGSGNSSNKDAVVYVWAAHEDGSAARTFCFDLSDEARAEALKIR